MDISKNPTKNVGIAKALLKLWILCNVHKACEVILSRLLYILNARTMPTIPCYNGCDISLVYTPSNCCTTQKNCTLKRPSNLTAEGASFSRYPYYHFPSCHSLPCSRASYPLHFSCVVYNPPLQYFCVVSISIQEPCQTLGTKQERNINNL